MTPNGDSVEVELRVGMLDVALAKLISAQHHTIEFPTLLLPENVVAGSVVKLHCTRAAEAEKLDDEKFDKVQQKILSLFASNLPKPPVLRVRNTTQTAVVLEWDPIDVASAELHSLALYKGSQRLGLIPDPLKRSVTKVSNLEVDEPNEFQLKLSTSAGEFDSNKLKVRTHKMTNLSGVVICLGSLNASKLQKPDIEKSLERLGSKPSQDKVKLETTHFVCSTEGGEQYERALEFSIPIVRPEWLKACETERRLVSVRGFYLSADSKSLSAQYSAPESSTTEVTQAETTQADSTPVEPITDQSAAEPTQAEPTQAESTQAESTPVESTPVESTPVEFAPVESTPVESTPAESTPVESTLSDNPQHDDLANAVETPYQEDHGETGYVNTHANDSQGDLSAAIEDVASSDDKALRDADQHRAPVRESEDNAEISNDEVLNRENLSEQALTEKLQNDPDAKLISSEEHSVVVEQGSPSEPQTASVADTHDISEDEHEIGKPIPEPVSGEEIPATVMNDKINAVVTEPAGKKSDSQPEKREVDVPTPAEPTEQPSDSQALETEPLAQPVESTDHTTPKNPESQPPEPPTPQPETEQLEAREPADETAREASSSKTEDAAVSVKANPNSTETLSTTEDNTTSNLPPTTTNASSSDKKPAPSKKNKNKNKNKRK